MTNIATKRPITPLSLFWYAALVTITGVVFELLAMEPVPADCVIRALVLWALCLMPIWLWSVRKEGTLPMFELLMLAFGGAYAVPVFMQPNAMLIHSVMVPFEWEQTAASLNLAILGVASLTVGYYAACRLCRIYIRPLDVPMASPVKIRAYLPMLTLVGFAAPLAIQLVAGLVAGAAVSTLKSLVNAGIIVTYFYPRRIWELNQKLVAYGLAGVAAVLGLESGLLENAAVPMVLVAIAKWTESKKLPWKFLFTMGVAFILANSVKMEFRKRVWYSDQSSGVVGNMATWKDLVSSSLAQESGNGLSTKFFDRLRGTLARVDLIHTLAWVQSLTPHTVPYRNGETYQYILYGWIPRTLWPDKPVAQQANITFAVDYQLLHDWQTTSTMIGIGHIAEGFANFGENGVLGAMLLEGAFLAILNTLLNGRRSQGGRAVYAGVMVYFFNGIGSATSMFFYLALQLTVANLFWLRLFSDSWRFKTGAKPPQSPLPRSASPTGLPPLAPQTSL